MRDQKTYEIHMTSSSGPMHEDFLSAVQETRNTQYESRNLSAKMPLFRAEPNYITRHQSEASRGSYGLCQMSFYNRKVETTYIYIQNQNIEPHSCYWY